jgi:phenylacetic acid degradation protein
LVGMGAILNDDVFVGENVVIGSGALVPPRQQIPPGVLVVGVPAKVVKELTPEMMEYALWGTHLYQTLPGRYHASLAEISLEEATG